MNSAWIAEWIILGNELAAAHNLITTWILGWLRYSFIIVHYALFYYTVFSQIYNLITFLEHCTICFFKGKTMSWLVVLLFDQFLSVNSLDSTAECTMQRLEAAAWLPCWHCSFIRPQSALPAPLKPFNESTLARAINIKTLNNAFSADT